jgi:hypothetical protein
MKILLLVLFVIGFFSTAYADQYGIALSNACLTMLKNGIAGCPSYVEIMTLFPDKTNPAVSGKFIEKDGIIQRGSPNMTNSWNYYKFSAEPVLHIDPVGDSRSRIKMIYIEASIPEYKIGVESLKMDDYTISFQKDRYINPNCSEIKVTAKNWVFLTGDSINILKHGCDLSVSQFDGTVTKSFARSYQDISTSFKWKHDLWVKENLIKCKIKGC